MRTLLTGLVCLALLSSVGRGEEWRTYRGPDGQGHSDAKNLPSTWSETENVLWKTPVPGRAWSSPVFADGVIWLTNAVETHPEEAADTVGKDKDGKEKAKKK